MKHSIQLLKLYGLLIVIPKNGVLSVLAFLLAFLLRTSASAQDVGARSAFFDVLKPKSARDSLMRTHKKIAFLPINVIVGSRDSSEYDGQSWIDLFWNGRKLKNPGLQTEGGSFSSIQFALENALREQEGFQLVLQNPIDTERILEEAGVSDALDSMDSSTVCTLLGVDAVIFGEMSYSNSTVYQYEMIGKDKYKESSYSKSKHQCILQLGVFDPRSIKPVWHFIRSFEKTRGAGTRVGVIGSISVIGMQRTKLIPDVDPKVISYLVKQFSNSLTAAYLSAKEGSE